MHILLVSDAWHPQINGVVRTLDTTRAIVEDKGHTFSRITPDQFRINLPMPMYQEIGLALFWPGAVSRRIKAIIREKGAIDAIHVATEGPLGMAARAFCQRNKIPFTTSFHTKLAEYINERTGIPARWLWRWLEWFHRPAQRVLVTNQGMADELAGFGIKHTHLWPRGVDLELFHPSKKPSTHVADLQRPVFVYVGRVAVEKNIESFLQLDLPGTKMIVGSGPSYDSLKAKYTDAVFTGPLHGDELAGAYADSDVFVFPSKTDTFGLVLLESCAAGTPVAAFPVTGPKDVITDPAVGTLSEDLQAACLRSLELSSEAARTYAEGFSWDAATQTFLDALERTSVTGNED